MSASSTRKATGVYYTPQRVVQYIVTQTLAPLLNAAPVDRPLRILEPACGEGVFLVEAYRQLLEWHGERYMHADSQRLSRPESANVSRKPGDSGQLTLADRKRILFASLFGVELDPRSAEKARCALANIAVQGDAEQAACLASELVSNIRCGDALLDGDFQPDLATDASATPFPWQDEFSVVLRGADPGFDAIIGNPPYVNVRVLARTRGDAVRQYLRRQYRCAFQCYDLYVLFLEKAFHLLRRDGMCGFIVPNKIATLEYARPCRSLLLEQTRLLQMVDLSDWKVFPDAAVYPYILIWQKGIPAAKHQIEARHVRAEEDLRNDRATLQVCQQDLSADTGLRIHGALDVEARVATRPLLELADLQCGTVGFHASRIAGELRERTMQPPDELLDFIVSGNIDRYTIRCGSVRYMKRHYTRPGLPVQSPHLSAAKRQLFQRPKIVIAGMTRRLEAAWDNEGVALGVQVYAAVVPPDQAEYCLGLLNSKLLSYLFRLRFQAKRLSGGFLAINKGQLGRLPIRAIGPGDASSQRRLRHMAGLVRRMRHLACRDHAHDCGKSAQRELHAEMVEIDSEIDQIVYELYKLTDEEVAQVESAFSD